MRIWLVLAIPEHNHDAKLTKKILKIPVSKNGIKAYYESIAMDDDNNVGKSAPGLSPEQKTLLDSSEFAEFIEAEIKFRVHEELHQLRLLQVGGLGLILLVACVGLALTVNAYQRLQDTKAKNDRIALVMAQVEAVLKATGTAHQESGGE